MGTETTDPPPAPPRPTQAIVYVDNPAVLERWGHRKWHGEVRAVEVRRNGMGHDTDVELVVAVVIVPARARRLSHRQRERAKKRATDP